MKTFDKILAIAIITIAIALFIDMKNSTYDPMTRELEQFSAQNHGSHQHQAPDSHFDQ